MSKRLPYSVLMSVYFKENPRFLRKSIESMIFQTIPPKQFVLVCDGPLTDELNMVVDDYVRMNPDLFTIVRSEENMGLGDALRLGMKHCRYEWVARMDSDDIAVPERCEWQIAAVKADPGLDIVGGQVREFVFCPEKALSVRRVPLDHDEIMVFSKKRNPFNHMTVFLRCTAALRVGGYRKCPLFEDYDLWVRMLSSEARAKNLDNILVLMRAGIGMSKRRGGFKYACSQIAFRRNMLRRNYINLIEFITIAIPHALVSILPSALRAGVYSMFLREQK